MTTIADQTTESRAKAEHTPQRCETCGGSGGVQVGDDGGTPIYDLCPDCDGAGGSKRVHPVVEKTPIPSLIAEIEKLRAFKAYVHQCLDAAGVPVDPDSPHKAEGCRIGGRLDIVLKHYAAMPAALAAMKQGRSALAVLAQSDPTYEPAWLALTDAIQAAEGTMRPAAIEDGPYLILDVEAVNRGDMLLWWKPKCAGYTVRLEEAGRYSAEQIARDPLYFNNGDRTLAIPERDVLQYAVRITPSDGTTLDKMRRHADAARERRNASKAHNSARKPGTLSALPTAPEGTCGQPSEAEQAEFDAENVADPYDGGRL